MKPALVLAALCAAAPAFAVLPTDMAKDAGRRFGRTSRVLSLPTVGDNLKERALRDFNGRHGVGVGGLGVAGVHGSVPPSSVQAAASSFLAETQAALGVDPQQLELLKTMDGEGGVRHALFRQVYKGLPVEFTSVKVHFGPDGKVLDFSSNFKRNLNLDVRPDVAASVAAYTVKKDLGEEVRSQSQLVVVLDPVSTAPRLAWKLVAEKGGKWAYFVDAHTGELIFRFDERRYAATPCGAGDAQGTVRAMIYPYDQEHGPVTANPMAHEWVYLAATGARGETDNQGQYCFPNSAALPGAGSKIFSFLQGPYVRVANSRGQSAWYANGAATWNHGLPGGLNSGVYPNNADVTQSVDVNAGGANPNVVAVAPIFANFSVGTVSAGAVGEAADITDDDQVSVLDASGTAVAFYVGTKTTFTGAPVAGTKYSLRLRSNSSGQGTGYSVVSSSGLIITTPAGNGNPATAGLPNGPNGSNNGSFDWWPGSFTSTGLRAEMAAFYQLNQVHDWFQGGVDKSSAAPLSQISAMVLLGPNIVNAFYDPEYDDMAFGDHDNTAPDDIFTDDGTVTHHEYTHFVVQRIWNIQNFGEAGAISEANADYFSATSLANGADPAPSSAIGKAVNESLGNIGPLRQLDGRNHPPLLMLANNGGTCGGGCVAQAWTGEIHTDSIFVSQSLWDLRHQVIANLGKTATCADQLQFQALLFFPESFQELVNALKHVADVGGAPACAGATAAQLKNEIASAFAAHGIPATNATADPWDTATSHNDGFESAVDISTIATLSATIYPASDIDFYTFAAGPGQISLELDLPQEGAYYSGYMITLFDHAHNQVAQAQANYNGINTDFGLCTQSDCTTTQASIKLNYMNPSGGQMFVEISGGPSDQGGSNSGVNNTSPYVLKTNFVRPYALSGGIINAKLDQDTISFAIQVTTWTSFQDYSFGWAQLRDQGQNVLSNTAATVPATAGSYLAFVSSKNALGQITGSVQLVNGFNARFPSVGTVYLEVFGYNVMGSTVSLGLSNPMYLTTDKSDVHAWNNVFNPRQGQKTTVRYDIQSAGHLVMRLYTLNGNLVQTLFDGDVQPGKGSVDWTGQNLSGATVASGIYLLNIQGPGISKTQKIAVIK